ncbi:unnamed protein product [Lactuca virosa]|uniref:Uncharacterized protein n=1 Tax=Lactuca virosa TaxID=75947 RepID=A0AAU9MD00_9ASTR|nr:unnamed protein product [Lactuca virosa]
MRGGTDGEARKASTLSHASDQERTAPSVRGGCNTRRTRGISHARFSSPFNFEGSYKRFYRSKFDFGGNLNEMRILPRDVVMR